MLTTETKAEEEDINRKITALGMKTGKITLEKPVQLGNLFSKPGAYALAVMMPVTMNGKTTNLVASIGMFRLRSRLVLGYVYSEYRGAESVLWVSKTAEDWADALLKANGE
jgi:hypothetical protein